MNVSFRQDAVLAYMVEHGSDRPYTTRQIANGLDVTTNAVLKALKRLRKSGSVFQYNNHWYMTIRARLKYLKDQVAYPDGMP